MMIQTQSEGGDIPGPGARTDGEEGVSRKGAGLTLQAHS